MQFIKTHKVAMTMLVVFLALIIASVAFLKATNFTFTNETQLAKNISIQAQIETDGSLSVVDQRTFDLTKNERLGWEIGKTTKCSQTSVSSVRAISEGEGDVEIITLNQATSNELGLDEWFFDEESNMFCASISGAKQNNNVVLEVSYAQKDAVFVYDDVAELYWDYLPAVNDLGFEDEHLTTDVSAQVLIPNASNAELVNRKTIWGWGHGFEGLVEFLDVGAYTFESQVTNDDKTSQAHIIFPSTCLVNYDKTSVTNIGGARKNSAISEENKWTDEWSVQQANFALINAWECVVAGLALLITTISYGRMLREYARILEEASTLEKQLAFDIRCQKFQKHTLILSCTLLLIFIFCLFFMKTIVGALAFLLTFSLCLQLCSWTPSVHSSFRDRIKG